MTNIIRKITDGYTDQRFNSDTGKLVSQEFVAGNGECEYEGDGGEAVDQAVADKLYHPFDMVQPKEIAGLAHAIAEALEKAAPEGIVVGEDERSVILDAIWDFERKNTNGE